MRPARTPSSSIRLAPPAIARNTRTSTPLSAASSARAAPGREGLRSAGGPVARGLGARSRGAERGAAPQERSDPPALESLDSAQRDRGGRAAQLPELPTDRARLVRFTEPRR